MIDSHCHLDADELAPADVTAAEARARGVSAIVMAGVDPANWAAQRELAARLPDVYPVFGLHPQLVAELSEREVDDGLAALERALAESRPVALGELGLDRFTEARKASLPLQERAFREQLRLARRANLPLVLHLLRADDLALRILAEEGVPEAGGVVHSFSGSADFARKVVRIGLCVSFCGSLTRPQSRRLREAALAVPEDRLLVETDSPDQAPEGHRGEVNRPALLPEIVKVLADLRGWTTDEAAAITARNARRLFALPAR